MANPQQHNSSKSTLNGTNTRLQPYSPAELREIAENVAAYQRHSIKEYSYTDHTGEVKIKHGKLWSFDRNRLFHITKNLYELGAHQPKESSTFTLQTLGETV